MSKLFSNRPQLVGVLLVALFSFSCGGQTASVQKNENNARLTGTWILQSRLDGEAESPALERQITFIFLGTDLFNARYRGDAAQEWIGAGQGSFSYNPPYLNLYWDSGTTTTLLVSEVGAERIRLHHGRNLVPMANQDPDEIFMREKTETGTGGRSG